jgi:hypothetical protein
MDGAGERFKGGSPMAVGKERAPGRAGGGMGAFQPCACEAFIF